MWIRSQNRMQLHDVNRFVIEQFETGIYIAGNGCTLGIYSTKEKALKVLDEIQTCIMTEHHYHTDDENCTRRFFTKEWKEIYQMPQDEDILVWDMDGTFDKENVWVDTWESPDCGVYELESGMDLEGLAWMSLPKPSKEKLEHENNR